MKKTKKIIKEMTKSVFVVCLVIISGCKSNTIEYEDFIDKCYIKREINTENFFDYFEVSKARTFLEKEETLDKSQYFEFAVFIANSESNRYFFKKVNNDSTKKLLNSKEIVPYLTIKCEVKGSDALYDLNTNELFFSETSDQRIEEEKIELDSSHTGYDIDGKRYYADSKALHYYEQKIITMFDQNTGLDKNFWEISSSVCENYKIIATGNRYTRYNNNGENRKDEWEYKIEPFIIEYFKIPEEMWTEENNENVIYLKYKNNKIIFYKSGKIIIDNKEYLSNESGFENVNPNSIFEIRTYCDSMQ